MNYVSDVAERLKRIWTDSHANKANANVWMQFQGYIYIYDILNANRAAKDYLLCKDIVE